MALKPGDRISPELLVLDPSGARRPLASLFGAESGLLIYLRHLG